MNEEAADGDLLSGFSSAHALSYFFRFIIIIIIIINGSVFRPLCVFAMRIDLLPDSRHPYRTGQCQSRSDVSRYLNDLLNGYCFRLAVTYSQG